MEQRFELGVVRITASIQGWLDEDPAHLASLHTVLRAHSSGDWGVVDAHDSDLMERNLAENERVMSVHWLADGPRIYVLTESPTSAPESTVCLPSEY